MPRELSPQEDPITDAPWLDRDERACWIALNAVMTTLPFALDAQLRRDSGLTHFEYTVLAMLSEHPDHTLRMSELAVVANGSLSRLSHVARRLEERGYLRRTPLPGDGRITVATLTSTGYDAVRAAAGGHVRHVRTLVFDQIDRGDLDRLFRVLMNVLSAVEPQAAAAVERLRAVES